MVLPSHLFEDAIAGRLRLVLSIDGEVYGGYIIFLPVEESEPFPFVRTAIQADGSTRTLSEYVTTDYIDIDFVDDIVYHGRMRLSGCIAMSAYDDDMNFVRALIERTVSEGAETHHVVPDGSYKYIRACSYGLDDYSLQLHYRSRRRR